jgi:hypothetical protein
MAGEPKPKRKALHRGIADAINRDASATSLLLNKVQPRPLRREPEQPATTRPPDEPVHLANPSASQTPSPPEPVAVTDPSTRPERTRSQGEPVHHTNGYIQVTNHLLDDILPTLSPQDQAVLVRLYRLTRGHKKSTCKVSRGKLIAKTGVKKTRLLQSLTNLEERGFIKRLPDDVESRDVYDRGMNIEMLLEGIERVRVPDPSVTRTRSQDGPNKESIKRIDNKEPIASLDTTKCPDCDGMGVRYIDPLDYSKGTVKCRHERLTAGK